MKIDMMDHLEELAEQIALYAKGDDVEYKLKLDSFKALANYQFNKNNPRKNPKTDEEEEDNFHDFRNRVEAASGGTGEDCPPEST